MSDDLAGCAVVAFVALFALGGLTALIVHDTREFRRDRRACVSAGGVYIRHGIEYRGNELYCIAPPTAVGFTE